MDTENAMKQKDAVIQRLNEEIEALKARHSGSTEDSQRNGSKEEIETLRGEMDRVNADNKALQQRLDRGDKEVERLKAENESLRSKVEELEAVIKGLGSKSTSKADAVTKPQSVVSNHDEVEDLRVSTDRKLIAQKAAKSTVVTVNTVDTVISVKVDEVKETAKGIFDEMVDEEDDAEDTIFGDKARASEDALRSKTESKTAGSAPTASTESVKENEDPLSSALPSLNVPEETAKSGSEQLLDGKEDGIGGVESTKKTKRPSGFFEGADSMKDIFGDDEDGEDGDDLFGAQKRRERQKNKNLMLKQDIKSLFDSDDEEDNAALFGDRKASKGADDEDTVNID